MQNKSLDVTIFKRRTKFRCCFNSEKNCDRFIFCNSIRKGIFCEQANELKPNNISNELMPNQETGRFKAKWNIAANDAKIQEEFTFDRRKITKKPKQRTKYP